MAAYRRVDDLQSPAGWLPVHRDQLWAKRSVTSMKSLYLITSEYETVQKSIFWRQTVYAVWVTHSRSSCFLVHTYTHNCLLSWCWGNFSNVALKSSMKMTPRSFCCESWKDELNGQFFSGWIHCLEFALTLSVGNPAAVNPRCSLLGEVDKENQNRNWFTWKCVYTSYSRRHSRQRGRAFSRVCLSVCLSVL